MYNQVKARAIWTFTLFHPFKKTEGKRFTEWLQLLQRSRAGLSEPFSEEPEPCQTGPKLNHFVEHTT